MKSSSYLSSARTTSVLTLLLVYVSLDQTSAFLRNAETLQQSREALDRAVVLQQVDQTQLAGATGIMETKANHSCGFLFDASNVPATRVLVTHADGRRWRADAFWCRAPGRDPNEPKMALQRIVRELHLPLSPSAETADLFNDIEHHLTDTQVNIAPLGFTMRGDLTPWVIGPVVVGLLALIRNCTRRVLQDEEHAAGEPWLLVDEGVGLERVIAGLWIAALALAPWASGASIFGAFAWRVYADGSLTTALTDVTLLAAALTILLSGGWLGLTVTADLIALRSARRDAPGQELAGTKS